MFKKLHLDAFKPIHWQHHRLFWLGITLLVIVLDQTSKNLALNFLNFNDPVTLIPNWFEFRLLFNSGAAFSLLADAGQWKHIFFFAVGTLICLVLLFWLWTGKILNRLLCTSITLIIGGAIGNLIDRFHYGYVIDFIQWHYKDVYYYPTFNIADSAITIGALLLIYDNLLHHKKKSSPDSLHPLDQNK